jgi:demethylmenaquinone methyltransferase/2-methoxy-6-polyprenyl-1,4-benzoquinol methylase
VQSKFYQPDEHRAEKVHDLFAAIARRYDLLNDLMSLGLHRRWKRRLVELAGSPRDVLDLCCGTGDLARLFDARVVGVDFTHEMLRVAQTRANNWWVRADALQLPFADNSFDVVSVGYGLRNLADVEAGLREILRVLRPGGKLLSLDFGKPESPLLRWLYFGYLRTVVPVLGRIFCGDADTHGYILVSLQAYGAQRGIKELMERCGYRDCAFVEFVGGTMAINFGRKPTGGTICRSPRRSVAGPPA